MRTTTSIAFKIGVGLSSLRHGVAGVRLSQFGSVDGGCL